MQSFTLDDPTEAGSTVRDQQRRVQRWTRAAAGAVGKRPMQGSECGMARGAWQFMGCPLVVVMVAASARCCAATSDIADAVPWPENTEIERFLYRTEGSLSGKPRTPEEG